ncbi:MAG: hypothetical protein JST75_07370 [Bacteroidetes bacterium]|nr:hypothetical protein [Bacteroidota bacterium]
MSTEKYITASCLISHSIVYLNDKAVFENKADSVSAFLDNAYQHFDLKYPKFYKMDNLSKLGVLGSDIMLKENFIPGKYQPAETGIVLMNASASLDTDIKYYKTVSEIASPALFVYTLPNIVIGEICIRNNFKGENAFFVFKNFDGKFMARYVNNLFDNGVIEACICGWLELIEEKYKLVLLLVEKEKTNQSIVFTEDNINKIYGIDNG